MNMLNRVLASTALGIFAISSPAMSVPNEPGLLAQATTSTKRPITIAVKEITNEAGDVWWWKPALSKRLTDMLATELKDTGNFTVVERAGLNKVLDEQALANSGNSTR